MAAEWMADRLTLQTLLREHPDWRLSELALPFKDYVMRMQAEARSEHRQRKHPKGQLRLALE